MIDKSGGNPLIPLKIGTSTFLIIMFSKSVQYIVDLLDCLVIIMKIFDFVSEEYFCLLFDDILIEVCVDDNGLFEFVVALFESG